MLLVHLSPEGAFISVALRGGRLALMQVIPQRGALPLITPAEKDEEESRDEWTRTVPGEILATLPDSEVNRQKCV